MVHTEGEGGEFRDYEIKYVLGIRPLQQYLVDFPGGAFQMLPFCWDSRTVEEGGRRWFHIYDRERIPHEAQAQSDDRESAPVGGAITLERLKAYGGDVEEVEAALEKAKKGVAGPLESDAGFHLVMKVGEE